MLVQIFCISLHHQTISNANIVIKVIYTIMRQNNFLKDVMLLAWQFVKRNGFTMSEALKTAWANMKLKLQMKSQIVKFYYKKVDGSLREAYGTLDERLMPAITGTDKRSKNDTVQVYFDTEKEEWRCFKKANLKPFNTNRP